MKMKAFNHMENPYDSNHMKITNREQKKINIGEKLFSAAARILKTNGINNISINKVMDEVGLTRGSFYVYFKNKGDMVLKAFKWSVHKSNDDVKNMLIHNGKDLENSLDEFIDFYLSSKHRDSIAQGCPIAALSRDFGSENKKTRNEFSKMLDFLFEERRTFLKSNNDPIARERWIGITSTYIGALTLSRATRGTELSEEILAAGRKYIKESV